MNRFPCSLVIVMTSLVASIVRAAEETKPTDVAVQRLNGREFTGTLVSLDKTRLQIRTTTVESIDLGRVFRIDFPRHKPKPPESHSFVYLTNGDRLAVSPMKSDGEDLHGVWSALPGKPAVKIPLLSVRGFLADRSAMKRDPRTPETAIFDRHQKLDLVVLKNGDRIVGRLKTLDEKSVTLDKTAAKVDRSTVRAIAFDPRFLDKPKRAAERIFVRLRDGSHFTATEGVPFSANRLRIKTTFGAALSIPVTSILSLQFVGKNVVPLSERQPAAFTHTPYIDGKKPLRTDRGVLGGRLTLRGREYSLGLGMHTRSRVDYDLKGDAQFFRATVGVDDSAKGRGSVVFRVEIDGKTVFASPVLTGSSAPLSVGPISLKGGKRLSLIADFASHGDLLDYADWCDAVLLK